MTLDALRARFADLGLELRLVEARGPDGRSLWTAYVARDGEPVGRGAGGT